MSISMSARRRNESSEKFCVVKNFVVCYLGGIETGDARQHLVSRFLERFSSLASDVSSIEITKKI
jgi:hypothetical protein